jgi:hypothetical protein
MKRPTLPHLFVMQRCLLLSGAAILFALSAPAQSSTPKPDAPVEWRNLCANTTRELLVVTTESGDTVQGYCVSVQYDEVAIRTVDGKVVRIARGTLKTVLALAVAENRMKVLGRGMKQGLRYGVKTTFSPLAPRWFSGDSGHPRLGCGGHAFLHPRRPVWRQAPATRARSSSIAIETR